MRALRRWIRRLCYRYHDVDLAIGPLLTLHFRCHQCGFTSNDWGEAERHLGWHPKWWQQ